MAPPILSALVCARFLSYIVQHLSFPAVRTSIKQYPLPSPHPSLPSFNTLEDMTRDCMVADGKDYRTARCKVRVSHTFSVTHPRLGSHARQLSVHADRNVRPNIRQKLEQQCHDLGADAVTVQTCHILNRMTMVDVDPTGTSEESTVTNKVSPARVLHHPPHSGPSSRQATLPLLQ